MNKFKKYCWPALALIFALLWAHTLWINNNLREQNTLLKRLDAVTLTWCEGVHRVNTVCEGAFIDVLQRLGLDNEMMPLVTTALWKRATGGYPVSKARQEWGAKEIAEGYLEKDSAIGGVDDPVPAIGGPEQ
jgi:hypothetical protein